MNLSMPIRKFTVKQVLIIIVSLGMIMLCIVYTIPSEVTVTTTTPLTNTKTVKDSSNAVMPIGHHGNQMDQVLRDPFTIQPEYQEQPTVVNNLENQMGSKSPINSNNAHTLIEKKVMSAEANDLIKLTGIVYSNKQHIAIIHSRNKSKAYFLNEFIGKYQVIDIQEDTVTLKDNDHQFILLLESAKPKGDK